MTLVLTGHHASYINIYVRIRALSAFLCQLQISKHAYTTEVSEIGKLVILITKHFPTHALPEGSAFSMALVLVSYV